MSNLIRCQNGHMFLSRRYGTICPYCNIELYFSDIEYMEISEDVPYGL